MCFQCKRLSPKSRMSDGERGVSRRIHYSALGSIWLSLDIEMSKAMMLRSQTISMFYGRQVAAPTMPRITRYLDRYLGGTNLEVFKVRRPSLLSYISHQRDPSGSLVPSHVLPPSYLPANKPQFGMYILFPISWMYYFGTNLDQRFSIPDFWPKPGETHRIPLEREEIGAELQRLKERRLRLRDQRLEREREGEEMQGAGDEESAQGEGT